MRLTIIPIDGAVIKDNQSYINIDLSSCGIPSNIHALQWFDTKGWIEFENPVDPFAPKQANEIIDALPDWALACVSAWESCVSETPPVLLNPEVQPGI